jgi:predicted ATPase
VCLLGRVQATAGPCCISRWPTRAVACLLARLATLPQRAHPRETLMELLWPGAAPEVGRRRLRQALSQLRSLLEPPDATWPPVLLADRQTVRLAPGAISCDALQFEQAAADGEAATAHALYVGEFMPGHYDDWVLVERQRLESLHEALPTDGRPSTPGPTLPATGAVAASRTVPTAAAGRHPAGPNPTRATTERPGATPLGTLPSYWTRGFGMAQTLARLRGMVVTQRLVSLIGPGGSGKTRLASELAQVLVEPAGPALSGAGALPAHAPFERVLYTALADCRDAASLAETLLRLLRPPPGGDGLQRLAALLDAAPTLAVFDNVEQLDDEAATWIESLLHATPSLHVLLTSRRRLGLDGERVFELPGLALAAPAADIESALASPAVALFVDRARASRPEFHLTAANLKPVVALTRLLGGMPLAIELAASRLRALQPAELLARLSDGAGSPLLDLLARPSARAGARSRHASMRHVVAWSWQQLRPELATLLCALSVMPGAMSAAAAAHALAALEAPEAEDAPNTGAASLIDGTPAGNTVRAPDIPRAQALLAEAVEGSLLRAQPTEDGTTLYTLLPPVREYAAEQCLVDAPRRVRHTLRRWLTLSATQLTPAESQRFRHETPHLEPLILAASADEALDPALALALATRFHWHVEEMPLAAVRGVLQQAVLATGDTGLASGGHELLALMLKIDGQHTESLREAELALALAPDPARRAHAQILRTSAALYLGVDATTIDGWLADALADAEASGDEAALLNVLRTQAMVAVNVREDYAAAIPHVERCLQLLERKGDLGLLRLRQLDLVACLGWTGREAAAATLCEAVIADARRFGETWTVVHGLVQLGRVRIRQRLPAQAARALEAAVHLGKKVRQRLFLLWPLLHLPEAWVMCGRAEPAALLQGYITTAWAQQMGVVNRIEARELRRARRLIVHALGVDRAQALMETGRALSQDEALALLPPPVEDGTASPAGQAR